MSTKQSPNPLRSTTRYFVGFSVIILMTNMLIYVLNYIKATPIPVSSIGLYANFIFFLAAIFLYVYCKKITLDDKDVFSELSEFESKYLQENSKHYRPYSDKWLIKNIPQILCIKDDQGRWLHASNSFLKLLRIDSDAYRGKTDMELGMDSPRLKDILLRNYEHDESVWEKHEAMTKVTELPSSKNNHVTIKLSKTPIYDRQGNRFKLITSGSEITPGEQKQNTLQLAASVFDQNIQSMLILDSQFNIMQINGVLTSLLGFSSKQIHNQHLSFLNEQDIDNMLIESIHKQIQSQQFWEGEFFCTRINSAPFPAKLNIAPVMSRSKGIIKHYIGILTDLSEQKTVDKKMERLALYDNLTGLPNRVMFIDRLNQALVDAKNQSLHAILLFIDLDKFKAVNDTMGHRAGDALLKEVAIRLSDSIRSNDLVARLSGDEFAVLMKNINSYDSSRKIATIVADKIITLLTQVFHIQRKEVLIGASIGIGIYPEDANNGQNLLKHSDIAMYSAKENGRNNYQFFNKEHIVKLQSKHQMATDLRTALERQEFKLFYQPQFDVNTCQLVGVEALVRWFKNYKKLVLPNEFIPVVEECGLIIPLGEWILETACTQQKAWLDAGYQLNRIAVNISGRQFFEDKFINTIEKILEKTALNPKHLELEITESMLMGDMDKVIHQLQSIHSKGITLAIDDFGTGFSSLSHLKDFPIDILKIDKSFVKNITNSAKEIDIVCAIIEMGHSLGLKIVAEGVETEEQFDFLKKNGCDSIQGFLLGKPLEAKDLVPLLQGTTALIE